MPPLNWYRFGFIQIGPDYMIDTIERSLSAIGESVAKCAERLEEAGASNNDFYEFIVDDETAFIEHLIGTAFVLCQGYITFIVSRIMVLHESCKQNGICLVTTGKEKADIMKFGSQLLPIVSRYDDLYRNSQNMGTDSI